MKLHAVFRKGWTRGNCLTRLTQYPPLLTSNIANACKPKREIMFMTLTELF